MATTFLPFRVQLQFEICERHFPQKQNQKTLLRRADAGHSVERFDNLSTRLKSKTARPQSSRHPAIVEIETCFTSRVLMNFSDRFSVSLWWASAMFLNKFKLELRRLTNDHAKRHRQPKVQNQIA